VVNGLKECEEYCIDIRGVCSNNKTTNWFGNLVVKTLGCDDPCLDPPNYRLTESVVDEYVILEIDQFPIDNYDRYEWRIRVDSNQALLIIEESVANQITLGPLPLCVDLYWEVRLRCKDTDEWTRWFEGNVFNVGEQECMVPMGFDTIQKAGETSAVIGIDRMDFEGYEVRYREKGTAMWNAENSLSNEITITPLIPCTEYEWNIRVMCAGACDWSDYFVDGLLKTQCTNACDTPAMTAFTSDIQGTTAILSVDLSTYEFYQWRWRVRDSGNVWDEDISMAPTITIDALIPCEDYEWELRVFCEAEDSWSEWFGDGTFVTDCICDPPMIGQMSVDSRTKESARLLLDIADYETILWRYRGLDSLAWSSTFSTAVNELLISNLTECIDYEWQVAIVCESGDTSIWSVSHIFNTTCDHYLSLRNTQIEYSNGDIIPINVRLLGFEDLAKVQFSIFWDEDRLDFENLDVSQAALGGFNSANIDVSTVQNGRLSVTWDAPSGNPVGTTDSLHLFFMNVRVKDDVCDTSRVSFWDIPLAIDFIGDGGQNVIVYRAGESFILNKANCLTNTRFIVNTELQVYPNPTRNTLTVSGPLVEGEVNRVKLIGINGQIYKMPFKIVNSGILLDMEHLLPGIYHLIVESGGSLGTAQCIKH
jgi:hypothetical protein